MNNTKAVNVFASVLLVWGVFTQPAEAASRKLKVFILAGQSNMEGHAEVGTFDYIGKDPLTAPMLKEMRNPDGTPRVCDRVWMSYLTGPYDGSANGEGLGKLTAGFGARGDQPTKDGGKIGPEFTFGIYMEKLLDQPILIIKAAWGGRSLNTEFRPPSAGPYQFNETQLEEMKKGGVDIEKSKEEKAKASGVFYRMMMEHVRKVLADPGRVCPEYDGKAGYELAGFVWFQGFNDLVDGATYPDHGQPDRYALYSDLLATFIRDVRKDLNAPDMPFVIGVLGVGGEKDQNTSRFRKAMAAPAALPEFRGNVVAVETAPFWDDEMEAAEPRKGEYDRIVGTAHSLKTDGSLDKDWKWENFWKPVGKPLPEERSWRFITIDPAEKKDKLEQYTDRRFREITLPAGMENWYLPDFDDSKWMEGRAPIGKGVWEHSGITLDNYPSTWGEGEFLLMRTTFEVDDLNFKEYRIAILARQGFDVYLNGNKIHTYIWWLDNPCYRSIVLTQDQMKFLKKGGNVLAAYANDQYGPNAPEHYAALDLRIEGITQADREKLDRALEEVCSTKDRETLKGASNGGYHYMGSAKIFAQIGKAFAEAMMTMRKKQANESEKEESAKPIAWQDLMTIAEVKRDPQGKLLPLQSYDQTIRRGMLFILDDHLKWFKGPPETLVDENGKTQMPWVYYSNLQHNGTPFPNSVDRFVSYPAFHHSLMIRTLIGYAKYADDPDAIRKAVELADWNIAHSTPADWAYGNLPWSTFQERKPGGFRDKSGLMPDKAAIMALAYLQLHEATHEARFLKAAEAIATTLAARQLPDGTWPFRADPKTEVVIEDYTSSVIYAVRVFEALDKLNGNDRYRPNRDKTWNWLVNGPIRTKEFRGFYEDIPASPQGRTNYDCLDTIRYLLANRTDTNGYLEMAKNLNAWVEQTFMDKIKDFGPAEGIREQLQCNVVMGIHSLNWASMLLELSKATGDEKLRQRAMQTANYITYYLQPDNRIVVGFQYHQWWYSCHTGVVLYLLDFAQNAEPAS